MTTITIDDLTFNISHLNGDKLIEDWRWMVGAEKQPILASAVGDVFLQDATDGSIHWLDVGLAEMEEVAANLDEFSELLRDKEFALKVLAAELIAKLHEAGKVLRFGEVYSFSIVPALGGKYTVENFNPTDIEVHFSLAGQMQEHIKSLPPGTVIPGAQ